MSPYGMTSLQEVKTLQEVSVIRDMWSDGLYIQPLKPSVSHYYITQSTIEEPFHMIMNEHERYIQIIYITKSFDGWVMTLEFCFIFNQIDSL